jgi:enoyl-CoA hydratase/carnithine racemase
MSCVEYRQESGIAYITLTRPERLNALSDAMASELFAAFTRFDADAEAGVAILHGAGRAFCSGADVMQRQLRPLSELRELGGPEGPGVVPIAEMLLQPTNYKPIIAAVHGYVIGAGLRLALHCELIIAAERTQFQVAEVGRGLDAGAFWGLIQHASQAPFATDVTLTARRWSAEEALARGVVMEMTPPDGHVAAAERCAQQLLRQPPLALRAAVEARRGVVREIELRMWLTRARGLHLTEDFQESARAFAEKREPHFHGR